MYFFNKNLFNKVFQEKKEEQQKKVSTELIKYDEPIALASGGYSFQELGQGKIDDFGREISTLKEVAEVINERKMISERVTSNSIKQAKYRLKKLGVLEDFLPDFEIFEKNDDFLLPNYRQPL